jgi:hypothetical protein
MLVRGSHLGVDRAQIDVPAPFAHVVGVTDGISELRPLAADITNSCHNSEVLPGLLPKINFTGNRRISPNEGSKPLQSDL